MIRYEDEYDSTETGAFRSLLRRKPAVIPRVIQYIQNLQTS